MLNPGAFANLIVVSRKEHGIYLAPSVDAGAEERVLLPRKEVPEDTQEGEPLKVFIYRDSSDRLIATLDVPAITLHEVKKLTVRQVTKIGAFLDWGLPKDLLLPFREMIGEVREGDEIPVALYLDKSRRLAATMKIYPYLRTDSPYHKGEHVSGTVYQIEESFGAFVLVDGIYSGMIPKREVPKGLSLHEEIAARVTRVHADGKLDLSLRETAYREIGPDAEKILSVINGTYGGRLPFDDKADPERIREVFGISKAAFKRAVGRLLKEGNIELSEGRILVITDED